MACSRVNFYFNLIFVLQSLNLLLKIIKLKQRIKCQFPVWIILVNCLLLMWRLLCASPWFGSEKVEWHLSSENVWKAKFLERYFKSKSVFHYYLLASENLEEGHELLVQSIKIDDSCFSSLEPLCHLLRVPFPEVNVQVRPYSSYVVLSNKKKNPK